MRVNDDGHPNYFRILCNCIRLCREGRERAFAERLLRLHISLDYFYMHGMARKVAANLSSPPLSTNTYISGVVAYEVSLLETKIALLLIVLSLALLVVFPASKSKRL
ncbi:hypothetical protein LAG73_02700 [Pseudoxanthomonas japonensis]|nr:hypothetical protein LAG73_02700 [Pseudoxanthomonas japonensis]